MRNRPAGYSMKTYFDVISKAGRVEVKDKIAASNQFIVFRPRDTVHYSVDYLHRWILNPLVQLVLGSNEMYENARADAWIRKLSEKNLLEELYADLPESLISNLFTKRQNKFIKKSEKEILFPETRRLFKEYELVRKKKEIFSFNSLRVLELRNLEVKVDKELNDQTYRIRELEAYEGVISDAKIKYTMYLEEGVKHLRDQFRISTNK
jgi:hypothetical protein